MNLADLGETFKSARIATRQTQAEVATRTGIGVQTVSKFERGALSDLSSVRLLALLTQVGLELVPRPAGHRRTLDDIARELNDEVRLAHAEETPPARRRVRHTRAEKVKPLAH